MYDSGEIKQESLVGNQFDLESVSSESDYESDYGRQGMLGHADDESYAEGGLISSH